MRDRESNDEIEQQEADRGTQHRDANAQRNHPDLISRHAAYPSGAERAAYPPRIVGPVKRGGTGIFTTGASSSSQDGHAHPPGTSRITIPSLVHLGCSPSKSSTSAGYDELVGCSPNCPQERRR